MWGGVKHRKHHGDLFRNWSATKGLESLRSSLYTEPRPWYLAFALHQHRHLLQDYHCARLLAWCTTVLEVRNELTAKKEAYRYAHETLHMLAHSHKVGKETLLQCMRLCAVGNDLTSAFNWYQYWIESHNDGAETLWPLVWLLRIAHETPSDDGAEDMAVAVRDAYLARIGAKEGAASASCSQYPQFIPESDDDEKQWKALRLAFHTLRPRLHDPSLLTFVDSLPVPADTSPQEASREWLRHGWPQPSHHHVFPQLEDGEKARFAEVPCVTTPFLRDSLLHPDFLVQLETAAFREHDAKKVVALLQIYKDEVQEEKLRRERKSERRGETELWRQHADPSAQRFRYALVDEGGLPPELYHYLIVALSVSHPSAALRTIQRMKEANLRLLDITRAVAIVASSGAPEMQLELFQAQLTEINSRHRLDADYDICKAVEHFWKFEYTNFFHYQNRLDEKEFYRFLLDGLGPAAVQRLVLDSQVCGPTATTEDLVVLNEPLRYAMADHFRQQVGSAAVEAALNAITQHVPKLDISLVNSAPHFADYALNEADTIATDMTALRDRLNGFDTIYLLDTSFVESSEGFLSLGKTTLSGEETPVPGASLVLVPFVVLQQLAESVTEAQRFVTFDPSLQEGLQEEPLLASRRLRALAAMTMRSPNVSSACDQSSPRLGRHARLLHFSECLVAQSMQPMLDLVGTRGSGDASPQHRVPATDDNAHLLLVLGMVRALSAPSTRVVLCTDDPQLQKYVEDVAESAQFFAGSVQLLSTRPPEEVIETAQVGGLLNDNPLLDVNVDAFEPKLTVSSATRNRRVEQARAVTAARGEHTQERSAAIAQVPGPVAEGSGEVLESPWLSLLNDAAELGESVVPPAELSVSAHHNPNPSVSAMPPSALDDDEAGQSEMEKLMELYESPHDVIPVGAKMMTASRVGSVFDEFDSVDPFDRALAAEERAARRSRLQAESGNTRQRRLTTLEKEFMQNRGASNKQRYLLARSLSNQSGGRVPFNLRYKVVEANINDPKNASLRHSYEQGLQRKREHFKRRQQR